MIAQLAARTAVVRDFTLAELDPGCSYAALGHGPGPGELITLWPSLAHSLWWVGVLDAPSGQTHFTRTPVHHSEIAACLRIMRVDASLLKWTARPCEPLIQSPYASNGKPPTSTRPAPTPSSVYFIRAGDSGPVKIGTAKDVRARLGNLQTSTAVPLHVLGVLDGGREVESSLHERFQHLRLRGEWFVPEPDLLDFIAEEAQPWKP